MQSEKQLEVRLCRQGEGSPWHWEPGLVALCVTPEPKHHPQPPAPSPPSPAPTLEMRPSPPAGVRFATPPVGQPVPEATACMHVSPDPPSPVTCPCHPRARTPNLFFLLLNCR